MDVLVALHPHLLAVLDGDSIGHYLLVAFFVGFTSNTEDVLRPRSGRKPLNPLNCPNMLRPSATTAAASYALVVKLN
jgi:hypothetical protein